MIEEESSNREDIRTSWSGISVPFVKCRVFSLAVNTVFLINYRLTLVGTLSLHRVLLAMGIAILPPPHFKLHRAASGTNPSATRPSHPPRVP
jgi:hypothetical protein